jgi:hypothetical protein
MKEQIIALLDGASETQIRLIYHFIRAFLVK